MNPVSQSKLQAHQATLLVAALASLLLWTIPFFGLVLLPLQYLNTHIHEFSHAFVAILTGGQVDTIHVYSNGSGVTLIAGGSPLLTNSAGYLGATIIGGLIIVFSRTEKGAGLTMRAIACLLLFSFVFWVRGDIVGLVSGVAWIALLFALPAKIRGRNLVFLAQFIGMQQCLESLQALYVQFKVSAYPVEIGSDAGNMAQFTGVPAMFWAVLWGAIGLGVLFVTLRFAWRNPPAA